MDALEKEILARAWEAFDAGRYGEARELYAQARARAEAGDLEVRRAVLMGLVYVESFSGAFDRARSFAAELLPLARDHEERHIYLHQAGMVERMAGDCPRAWALFDEEAKVIERYLAGDAMSRSANAYERGTVLLKWGRPDEAEAEMARALDQARKAEDPMCIGCAHRGMGEIMRALKRDEEARRCFSEALTAFEDAGDDLAVAEVRALMRADEDGRAAP